MIYNRSDLTKWLAQHDLQDCQLPTLKRDLIVNTPYGTLSPAGAPCVRIVLLYRDRYQIRPEPDVPSTPV